MWFWRPWFLLILLMATQQCTGFYPTPFLHHKCWANGIAKTDFSTAEDIQGNSWAGHLMEVPLMVFSVRSVLPQQRNKHIWPLRLSWRSAPKSSGSPVKQRYSFWIAGSSVCEAGWPCNLVRWRFYSKKQHLRQNFKSYTQIFKHSFEHLISPRLPSLF